jgi:tetratricopeptide (TPR) repeat protein
LYSLPCYVTAMGRSFCGWLLVASVLGQVPTLEDIEKRNARMNLLRSAAESYRSGNTPYALELVDRLSKGDQDATALTVTHLMRLWPAGKDETLPPSLSGRSLRIQLKRWDILLARALGALYMEALLRAYRERDTRVYDQSIRFAEGAETLFDFIAEYTPGPSPAPRWELAIGLSAFGDGQLGWASLVLAEGCRRHPEHAALLLACGSLRDVIAAQPADLLLRTVREVSTRPIGLPRPMISTDKSRDVNIANLPSAAAETNLVTFAREVDLEAAAGQLRGVLKVDPENAEARLRLAHVHIMRGHDGEAGPLLEEIVSAKIVSTARIDYLALLFLGGVYQRGGHFDAAAALLERAVTMFPSGQSAFVALADGERTRGNAAGATAIIDRMLRAPSSPTDPWTDYRFGQYWVPTPQLAALRKEAIE